MKKVAIIGGGTIGRSMAICLANEGFEVASEGFDVVEAEGRSFAIFNFHDDDVMPSPLVKKTWERPRNKNNWKARRNARRGKKKK